ncbi:hypothetical protein STVA_41160 [Allostella vacuolata]|nr:hypothetical protein STVA_41160 [Stella vacuolata]
MSRKLRRLVGMGEKVFVSVPREAVKHFIGRGPYDRTDAGAPGEGSAQKAGWERYHAIAAGRDGEAATTRRTGSLDAGGLPGNIPPARQRMEAAGTRKPWP